MFDISNKIQDILAAINSNTGFFELINSEFELIHPLFNFLLFPL